MIGRDIFDDFIETLTDDDLEGAECHCDDCGEPIHGQPVVMVGVVIRGEFHEVAELHAECADAYD